MLRSYIKIALKVFLRRKFFTFISLFGISFTLLVLMTATAGLDHLFGPMPPETHHDRSLVVILAKMSGPRGSRTGMPGYKLLDQCARDLPGAERVSFHTVFTPVASYRDGQRMDLFLKHTDADFWRVYDFRFLEGGPFSAADEANGSFVAVINEATRHKYFGDGPAVGKTLDADGHGFRVVGVVANVPIFRIVTFADVWVPLGTSKGDAWRRDLLGNFVGTILAHDASALPGIRTEYKERVARLPLPDPKTFDRLQSSAETFFESFAREFFYWREESSAVGLLAVIIAVMVLFMILPTINLVNLGVSRIMERASEIGVRKAFGASRRTLVGQFVVENVMLCLIGGALGFVLSWLALGILSYSGLVPYAEFHLNHRVFLYGLGLATFFGVFSGVYPAWKMSRLNPVDALRGGSR